MNDDADHQDSVSPGRNNLPADWAAERDGSAASAEPRPAPAALAAKPQVNGHVASPPLDLSPLVEAILKRWPWILAGGFALALLGLGAGLRLFQTGYTAVAQLVRYDSPNLEEVFHPRLTSPQTFANMLRSPDLLRRVSAQAQPPVSPEALAAGVRVSPERNSEVVIVVLTGNDPQTVVSLVNLYAREAVSFLQGMQSREAAEVNKYVTGQLAQIDEETRALYDRLALAPRPETTATAQPLQATRLALTSRKVLEGLNAKLVAAHEELADLLGKYTEANTLVQQQRAKLKEIEKQIAAVSSAGGSSNDSREDNAEPGGAKRSEPAAGAVGISADAPEAEVILGKLQSLETGRLALVGRQRAARMFEEHPAGYFRLLAPATIESVAVHDRRMKVLFLAVLAGLMGAIGAAGLILCLEILDDRLKTAADIKRVTRLPVVATLGDLRQMDSSAQRDWAFRAWTALQGRLSPSPNHGLICGVTSSLRGEGRSTWVDLLAQAASESGFRVVTIGTRPTPPHPQPPDRSQDAEAAEDARPLSSAFLTSNFLDAPSRVSQALAGPNAPPRVHIPVPGWVWSLERRKQWQSALHHWRHIDNVVILVELPPASVPEAVLLAENLPNLIWLAEGQRAKAGDTRKQLQTLRQARCHLVGAVLNRESAVPLESRFPRWMGE